MREHGEFLIVGQSHAAALWKAAIDETPRRFTPLRLRSWTTDGHQGPLLEMTLCRESGLSTDGAWEGPQFEREQGDWWGDGWERLASTSPARAAEAGSAAILWAGFPMFCWVLMGQRFDVALDDESELSPEDVLIPRSAVEERLNEWLNVTLYRKLVAAFAGVLPPGRLAILAPPPPVAGSVVRKRVMEGDGVRERIELLGLGDASTIPLIDDLISVKLWRILLRIHESIATELGATFVPPPSESLAADGTLQPQFLGQDAQHANPEYGALYLTKIVETIGE